MSERFLGITVLPEFYQNEGIDGVLDNLVRMGATAVATSPYVMAPADERTGVREPPDDAGAGQVRLIDRPLWGRRDLYVRTAPSFTPDGRLYAGLRYLPPPTGELTKSDGAIVGRFIRAAQARHLKVYFQVQAAIPPGYRVQFGGPQDEDQPRLPDGRVPPRRLAKNGSLASRHIVDYACALTRDLLREYPDVDGFRYDWPEYPPYFLDDVFLDFGAPAEAAAKRLGFDFARMRTAAERLYRHLHGKLTDAELARWSQPDGGRYFLARAMADQPGLVDWLRFKSVLVEELLTALRRELTEAGGERVELMPNAFAPPLTLASGFDFGRVGRLCSGMSVKLYTMHWSMILNFYGTELLKANPQVTERALVRALVRVLDLADDEGLPTLADYSYPEPDRPHPIASAVLARKLAQAQAEAGSAAVLGLAHGYGPADDFRRRLQTAWQASGSKVWINRYAYLSDEKIGIVADVCAK